MHKKFFIVTAIVLAVAAGLASAVAQITQSGRHGRHNNGWMLQHMAAQLNLTDAQQAQIKNILQAEKAKTQPLRQHLRQNRLAQTSNTTGAFNEPQARPFADNQARLMSDLTVERQRAKSQIFAVLTPDQRQKALTLIHQRQQRRQHHMQKNSGPEASATPS